MALTAAEIQNVSFSVDRKGYDVDEVDVFLEHVADEVDAMNQRIVELEAQLEANEFAQDEAASKADASEGAADDETAALKARIEELEAELSEKSANDNAISQALIVAQRSADEVLSNARAEASGIIKDADEEADRIINKAETDRLRIAEAIRTLESDRDDVRADYREMLANFLSEVQKKLAEIDGDSRRSAVSTQARNEANAAAYAPNAGVVTTPPAEAASFEAPATHATEPAASGYIDKDFTGFGAADADFEFDDID